MEATDDYLLKCFSSASQAYISVLGREYYFGFQKDEPKRVFPTDGSPLKFYPAETTMKHKEGPGAAQVYEQITSMIPAIDFTVSEPWQVSIKQFSILFFA